MVFRLSLECSKNISDKTKMVVIQKKQRELVSQMHFVHVWKIAISQVKAKEETVRTSTYNEWRIMSSTKENV